MYEFDVVIVEDETGGYVAFVPALPGCHTQGDTLGELMDNVKEAINLYLETLSGRGSNLIGGASALGSTSKVK